MYLHLTNSVRWAFKATVLVALVATIFAVSQSSLAAQDELILTAVAIDLLLTVPVVYFLLIRKTMVPRITVLPVFFTCFFLGSILLPNGLGAISLIGTIVAPAVELVGLGYLGLRIFRTRKNYASEKNSGLDLMENLRKAFERELKPLAVARAAAFEIGVLGYLLFVWRRQQGTGFTYHRRNSPELLLAVILFLLIVETIGIHLLLALWSPTMAWVATAFSIYLGMQLIAHLKAMKLRPIVITGSVVLIRCGILGDVAIPRRAIARVSIVGHDAPAGLDLLPLGGMSQPNVRLELSEPVTVFGVYGTKKEASRIRISVDDPDAFATAVAEPA